jgi:hypothetical protein
MNEKKSIRLRALIPAFWASVFDIAVTIIHQAPEYWSGDLQKANEGNPIGGPLMRSHVSGIFVISGLWLILIGLLGYYLPPKLSRIFLLFVVIVHSYGASTWISPRYGFWWVMTLIVFNATLYVLVDEMRKSSTSNLALIKK